MHSSFLFVGERRSRRAIDMDVHWEDGRLAASTLFKALVACGVQPSDCQFHNLWYDDGTLDPNTVRFARGAEYRLVALGRRVSRELTRLGIRHRYMTHPAARGAIRSTERYMAHVRQVLTGAQERAETS